MEMVVIEAGEIISFIDLDLNRELFPKGGKRKKLVLFYGRAMTFWDALGIEVCHLDQPEYLRGGAVKIIESGPLRAILEVYLKISEAS